MNTPLPDWATALPGVRLEASFGLHFDDPRAEAAAALGGTIVSPLAHLGLLRASGPDTRSFLQGQFSNDVTRVMPERAQLSSYNSPKGRMLAVLHVLADADSLILELHGGSLESVLKRLRMYVLRSKVTLAKITDRAVLGLAGPDAPDVLAGLGLPAPTDVLGCAWQDDVCVVRRQGDIPRYTLQVLAERAPALWQKLAEQAMHAGTAAWKLLEILAGVPTVYPATQDRFVPQMCNLDTLGGISFDKGCYTGQEIVARVHYRGAVKRRMLTWRRPESVLEPGAKITLDDGSAADVVDSAAHPDGGCLALAVGPS